MNESVVVLFGIGMLLYGLIRFLPNKPIYLSLCGNKNCKRLRLEKDGGMTQDIMEGMKCPICKENFQKLIDSCKK